MWGLEWPFTAAGFVAIQACPGLSESTGEYMHNIHVHEGLLIM